MNCRFPAIAALVWIAVAAHAGAALAATAQTLPDAVAIPAGDFLMGCVPADTGCEAIEQPRHRVTISQPYRLARTETTIAQFRKFVLTTGYRTAAEQRGQGRFWRFDINEWDWIAGLDWQHPFDAATVGGDDWPVVQIAWPDANAYCRWAGGRLPSEAEWERAARGGRDGKLHVWGNARLPLLNGVPQANGPDANTAREFTSFAAFAGYDDGFARIAPVAQFPANGFGLHDMAGNVYEWTADWIDDAPYPAGDAIDPKGRPTGEIKAVRGAGWGYPPSQFRTSFRGIAGTDFWTATFGFRCAWDDKPVS